MPVRRKEANYPDPFNGVRVMIEFQRPSHDVMVVGVNFTNSKPNPLTDFISEPVCPQYISVETSSFTSNFLPGNNQGFLQQNITMTKKSGGQTSPFKLQLRLQFTDGGVHHQVSFEVPAVSSPANTYSGAGEGTSGGGKWAVDLVER